MNSEQYLDVLENYLLPSVEILIPDGIWTYQQDNAPCHKSKVVLNWLKENDVDVLPWPARSPDLNPIEHIWHLMDLELAKLNLTSLAELEQALHTIWNQISRQTVLSMIESMPSRLKNCLKAKGGHFEF